LDNLLGTFLALYGFQYNEVFAYILLVIDVSFIVFTQLLDFD